VVPVIRLLIADDHQVIREGLEQLFATVPGVDVVGLAADGGQAVTLANQTVPDVVLMDISMPRLDGIEASRQITAAHPAARIIILTAHEDQSLIQEAQQAGAAGYLLKHSHAEDIVQAVKAVYSDGRLPDMAARGDPMRSGLDRPKPR
jgi:DNA-binding NarL/FixJ family response regulator